MKLQGVDIYTGSRDLTAEIDGAHIRVACGYADSNEAMITPDQARVFGAGLIAMADEIAERVASALDKP